jgi:tetratricopeptide (TPR) repeat protein
MAQQAQGYQAFRTKQYAAARGHFQKAYALLAQSLGEDHRDSLVALSDLASSCAALGDVAAARAAHMAALAIRRRTLGPAHPDVAASLHNLGLTLSSAGENEAAEACQKEALAIWRGILPADHPLIAKVLTTLGSLAWQRGDAGTARQAWEAVRLAPDSSTGSTSQRAKLHYNLGVACRVLRDLDAAATHFQAAVEADPSLAGARHSLAAALARLGRQQEADRQLFEALRQQSVFVQTAPRALARILIPSLPHSGNVPLEHLLPEQTFTRLWWFVSPDADTPPACLPPFDLVFNGIGDPDLSGLAEPRLNAFLPVCGRPVLNPPDRIARTRRDRLPMLAASIDGLVVPDICRFEAPATVAVFRARLDQAGIAPPFLLRPAGAHGGRAVALIEYWEQADPAQLTPGAWYAVQFQACRAPDGFVRKYRVIFVDRKPFAYHLAISPHWLVHYFSADMEAHDWKLAEEARFLADPRSCLGDTAYRAIAALGEAIDLDYAGVDFCVLPDGRALVFEANATMLVHPEDANGRLAFKIPAIRAITDAMQNLLLRPALR